MYVRMMRSPLRAGSTEALLRVWREDVIPAAEQQHGYLGATLLVEQDGTHGTSMTRWETLADLEAAETNGFLQAQVAKLAPHLAGAPERKVAEMVFERLAAGASAAGA